MWNEVSLHEVLDDTVELGTLVAESRCANGQGPKVLGGLWNGLSLESSGQAPRKRLSVLNGAYTAEKPNDDWL